MTTAALFLALLLPPGTQPLDHHEGLFAMDLRKPNNDMVHANCGLLSEWQSIMDWRGIDAGAPGLAVQWTGAKGSWRMKDLRVTIIADGPRQWLTVEGAETCRIERVEWPRWRGDEFVEVQASGGTERRTVGVEMPPLWHWPRMAQVVTWPVPDGLARPLVFGPVTVGGATQ